MSELKVSIASLPGLPGNPSKRSLTKTMDARIKSGHDDDVCNDVERYRGRLFAFAIQARTSGMISGNSARTSSRVMPARMRRS